MKSITLQISVQGDSHDELSRRAEEEIVKFLGVSIDYDEDYEEHEYREEMKSVLKNVSYDMVVFENADITSDYLYTAAITARLRNV